MAEVLAGLGAALLLTLVAEAAAAWLLGLRTWRAQGMLALINIITNPALNILLATLNYFGVYAAVSPFDPLLILLECSVAALEAALLKQALGLPLRKAAVLSIVLNAVSYLAGVFLLW